MIDVRANSIIYQSQIYYRDLVNDLVENKKHGKALEPKWNKADLILGYLEALNYRHLLTEEEDINNVNHILECLIKLCELYQFPTAAPLTFQPAPDIITGRQGEPGEDGDEGAQGPTGLATDFSVLNTSVTVVVDSFLIGDANAARWDYWVQNTGGAQRVSSILGHWLANGTYDLADIGSDDLGGSTAGIEFDINISGGEVRLVATITTDTWNIIGTRYFIPNNGNGTGPISGSLADGAVYIGNSSNLAQARFLSGALTIDNTGIVTLSNNVILNANINSTAGIEVTKLEALTASRLVGTDGAGFLLTLDTATYPDLTELSYLKGVNSPLQDQIDNLPYLLLAGGTMSGDIDMDGNQVTGLAPGTTTGEAVAYEQLDDKVDKLVTTNRQIANYVLVLGDKDLLVEMNVGSANTLTVPPNSDVAFPIGTQVLVSQYGTGTTTITPGSGVTLRSEAGMLDIRDQYCGVALLKIATNEWYVFGALV